MHLPRRSWRHLDRLHRTLPRLEGSARLGAVSALIADSLETIRGELDAGRRPPRAVRNRVARLEEVAFELRRRHEADALLRLLNEAESLLGETLEKLRS